MTLFLKKFQILESLYKDLKNRFELLEEKSSALSQPNPYLKILIDYNKDKIETNLAKIQSDIFVLEQGELLSTPEKYAEKLETLGTTPRELYYDTLLQAIDQRLGQEFQQRLLAADNLLKELSKDISPREAPLITTFSGKEPSPGYIYRVSKKIGLPFSAMDDISYYSIIAHELAHEVLAEFSISLQSLLGVALWAREEFSRRYGIKRTSFDKFIKAVDSIPLRREEFIDDMKRYLTTYSTYIPVGEDSIIERVKDFLSEIGPYTFDIERYFIEKSVNPEWLGEIIADIIEIKLMGPLSFDTSIKISSPEYPKPDEYTGDLANFHWRGTHPPDTFRIFFMKEILDANGLGDVVKEEWETWIEGLPEKVREEFIKNEGYLKKILNFVEHCMEKEGYPNQVFTKDDYVRSMEASKELLKGNIVEQEKSSVILNAAKIAIDDGGNRPEINKLTIESLCKKQI